jgi:hypothetical protein
MCKIIKLISNFFVQEKYVFSYVTTCLLGQLDEKKNHMKN